MSTVAAAAGSLTERSALSLAAAIRTGEVSARDVVEAHIERLQAVQSRINALAAERFASAREEADAADRRVADADDPERIKRGRERPGERPQSFRRLTRAFDIR